MSTTIASSQDIEIGVNAENAVLQKISELKDITLFRNFPLGCQDAKGAISYLQCDLIAVSGLDVFVIEVKGWNAEMKISGTYYDKEWSTEYYNCLGDRCKGTILNIYSQNAHHIDALKTIVNDDRVKYHNLIVFTNKSIACQVSVPSNTSCMITNLDNVSTTIRNNIHVAAQDNSLIELLAKYQQEHTEDMFFDFLYKAVSDALNKK